MSHRYKDWQTPPSSLPRRYYSLPRDYTSQDTNTRSVSPTHSSKHRSSSASSSTPSTQSRYGSSRTYGAATDAYSTADAKRSTPRLTASSGASSVGTSSYPRKGSFSRDKASSLPSSPAKSTSYSTRHVSSVPYRSSTSRKSSWDPDTPPVRQHSSSSLRDYNSSWGPDSAPVRQHSSSSLRDSPFTLTSSRRKRSSSRDYTSDDASRTSPRRTPSPVEAPASPKRPTSPSAVYYEGSQVKPVKPAALTYHGSRQRQESVSSKSDAGSASSSRRGSSSSITQEPGIPNNNDNDHLEESTARDISLLSREIASTYEGSLSRSDSKRGKGPTVLPQKQKTGSSKEEIPKIKNGRPSKDLSKKEKGGAKGSAFGRRRKISTEKSPWSDGDIQSHKRSSSIGSATSRDETKGKTEKNVGKKPGFFSRKKSRESTDSEGEEERVHRKGSGGLFTRKKSTESMKSSERRGSASSSPSLSPPVTPPKRKISGPGRLFFPSGDSKTTPDIQRKKFSVPGKYFQSKDSKSGGDSSDNLESESERSSRAPLKRRVSLPGMLGFQRSSSAERNSGGQRDPEPLIDPELLKRRRSFKKTKSFDASKKLNKLKFWDYTKKDKSPDSRGSASPDDGRSRSQSPAAEVSLGKEAADKMSAKELDENCSSQLRKSRERTVKTQSSEEKQISGEHDVHPNKLGETKVTVPSLGEKSQGSQVETVAPSVGTSPSVQKPGKEPRVRYVGPVESPSPSELRAKRKAQYKVNNNGKESEVKANTAEQQANKKNSEAVKKDEDKPTIVGDTTRDTVSKLRERRRKRKEDRERFFAGFGGKEEQDKPAEVTQDVVDGKSPLEENLKKHEQRNGEIPSQKNVNENGVKHHPQLGDIGKKYTIDDMSGREKVRSGKPRYQTIASSVHADIISDLIRERGLKTVEAEVKIPSVAELRAKFLISKDDNKVIPPRTVVKLEDRPHSICGETLSPTEMRKFEEINFSLAKKVSSENMEKKDFLDSSNETLPKVESKVDAKSYVPVKEKSHQSPPPSPKVQSVAKEEKVKKEVGKGDVAKDDRDLSPEGEVKKKRGSKKKRKKSLFGGDKETKALEEENDMPQTGAVSAAIKAMFSRRGSMDKSKISRKQRAKTIGSEERAEALKAALEARERKKSLPEHVAVKPPVKEAQAKVDKKEVKSERIEETKDVGKDKGIELQPITEIEPKPVKERKSLKKPSKNKKRKFSSSLKPFSMMKTKSESNLLGGRFDFVAVDIPLEIQEPEKEDKDEKPQVIEQEELVPEVPPSPIMRGRRPSVFEEGLKEFYEMKAVESENLKAPEPAKFEITLEDLDAVSGQTSGQLRSLAEDKMKIKPKRHHRTKSNPIKSLQKRDDIRTDTEVERPRIEKKPVTSEHPVIRRKKKKYKDPDNLWRRHTCDLAASALAGLASTEDFTRVRLRKTAGPDEKDEFRGTKPTMLIHIKGRRHLQVRLIEPCQKSLNSGDCFALVTEKELFSFIGKDCNPYEKAKVTEIVSKIKTKAELDCKAREIVTIEEGDEDNNAALDKFWKILNGDADAKMKGGQSLPKDEEYEKGVVKGNMVYKIHWTDPPSLMPVETMCGHIPQFFILDTKEVFIFDFGSELYVWNGQQSLSGQRKSAFALARQLYEEAFKPYGNYDPIFPYGKPENCNIQVDNKTMSKRPPWTLFARLHEKAETILFREKFLDWPDPTKIIKMKGHPSCLDLSIKPSPPVELKPYDAKKMLQDPGPLQCPNFEGANIGRGNGVPTVWVGDVYKEGNLVTTVGLKVWHINEYRHFELPAAHFGHFHSGEGYVIRWAYFVLADRVVKDRKSRCRSTVAGRVRCAYFFWQGNDCSVNEKGAAAIMAVELDEEKGPQVRVVQGKENPVFLNLFKGGMIIHNGSVPKCWYDLEKKTPSDETTATFSDTSTIRLYVIRNEEPGEACLNQVRANSFSLRSRTSLVLLLCQDAHIFLWHGSKSSEDSRSAAKAAAKKMQERKSMECNVAGVSAITIGEIEEGNEPDDFWKALGGKKYYCSLANDPSKHHYQPRLFEMNSATGLFTASEVLCPSRSDPKLCPFPFLQEDMYTSKQPGLFIVDGYYEVYIWEGWMREDDDDARTGSGRQRWDRDRRLAMQTALNYAKDAGKRVSHRVYVVYAGMEPQTFKALFPYWNDSQDVIRIQKQDGKTPNAKYLASDLLEQFTKEFYTLDELKKIPPPQGVDPAKLEAYLSDSDFMEIFKMDKEAFNKLQEWKQQNLKRPVGLF